jgi:hypothetical protein
MASRIQYHAEMKRCNFHFSLRREPALSPADFSTKSPKQIDKHAGRFSTGKTFLTSLFKDIITGLQKKKPNIPQIKKLFIYFLQFS